MAWFSRPGTASAFTPRLGIVQEWRTSAAVIRMRVSTPHGRTKRLSTSNSRNSPGVRSSVGTMYESNSKLVKSA